MTRECVCCQVRVLVPARDQQYGFSHIPTSCSQLIMSCKVTLTSSYSFILKHLLNFYLKGSYRERRWRAVFHPLVPYPNDLSGQSWVGLKLRAGSLFWTSSSEYQPKTLGHPLLSSQAISRELDWKWTSQDLNWCAHGSLVPQAEAYPTRGQCQLQPTAFSTLVKQ